MLGTTDRTCEAGGGASVLLQAGRGHRLGERGGRWMGAPRASEDDCVLLLDLWFGSVVVLRGCVTLLIYSSCVARSC